MNNLMDSQSRVHLVQDSVLDQRGLQSIKRMNNNEQTPEAMREVAKKFEGMLLSQMLKTMRETNEVFAEGNYLSSNEEKFHRDMMDEQMVLNLTSGRGIGIADHFYKQMMVRHESNTPKDSAVDGVIRPQALPMPLDGRGKAPLSSQMSVPSGASASLQMAKVGSARQLELARAPVIDEPTTAINTPLSSLASDRQSLNKSGLIDSLEAELAQLMKDHQTQTPRLAETEASREARTKDNAHLGDHFDHYGGVTRASAFGEFGNSLSSAGLRMAPRVDKAASINISGAASSSPAQRNFVEAIRPHAEVAARELNLDANVLIAQAALETGWGKHELKSSAGERSFNLFNIKATGAWNGPRVGVSTLEYENGVGRYESAQFRKYNSYAESFNDYVKLIGTSDRYQKARAVSENPAQYADALQAAGYATDPNYAKKIKQLLKHELLNAVPSLASVSAAITPARASFSGLME